MAILSQNVHDLDLDLSEGITIEYRYANQKLIPEFQSNSK